MEEGDFPKQRRNLIVVSLLLLAALLWGAPVSKVSVAGVDLLIPDERRLSFYIWPFWLYCLWRYFQFFSLNPVRSAYQTSIVQVMRYAALLWLRRTYKDRLPSDTLKAADATFGRTDFGFRAVFTAPQPHQERIRKVAAPEAGDLTLEFREQEELRWVKPLAVLFALVRAHQVSDYLIPLGIAAAPAAYAAWLCVTTDPQPELLNSWSSGG